MLLHVLVTSQHWLDSLKSVISISITSYTVKTQSYLRSKTFFFLGVVPIGEEKTVCAGSEKFYKMCESNEVSKLCEVETGTLKSSDFKWSCRSFHSEKQFKAHFSLNVFFPWKLDMTFHLFVCALAGAGAAVIAMVSFD